MYLCIDVVAIKLWALPQKVKSCYICYKKLCHVFLCCFEFQAVWFGCDVGQHFERKRGALHLDM